MATSAASAIAVPELGHEAAWTHSLLPPKLLA
jgi:hypothetical protein